ncbi:endonuclease NucS domain-containing protein [Picosynechococcus sp. PCC 73109]|uniref:endonuclease NucS domain-containing protein n=1 Tax=Picosynechococcus sp. PCC 73109 TaxID=374982 RepID=UPI000745930E|nr:endonuclease NucS domain-containing protein [Picosynechococcus sp. PCC 73109]AMA10398.1 hypothetical protein AWQ23_14365 [Picosynechococcus sp. PCC 73109]
MQQSYRLIKKQEQWHFGSEAELENFIWDNLKDIFDLTPLKRQHYIDNNICDILAVSKNKELAIIELKNAGDRHVIQQLTRYYYATSKQKPFSDKIDYDQPAILIIIAPIFHDETLINCLYHKLAFELFQFSIVGDLHPQFKLKKIKEDAIHCFETPLKPKLEGNHEISPPSQAFLNILARCEKNYDTHLILKIREKILAFDHRVCEIKRTPNLFLFGKNEKDFCIDLRFIKRKLFKDFFRYELEISFRLPISFSKPYRFSRYTLTSSHFQMYPLIEGFKIEGNLNCFHLERNTQGKSKGWMGGATSHLLSFYIYDFLYAELDLDCEWNPDELSKHLVKYCTMENLPNPLDSAESLVMFLVEITLRLWVKKFDVK